MEEDCFMAERQTFMDLVRLKGKLELVFAGKLNRWYLLELTTRVVLARDV